MGLRRYPPQVELSGLKSPKFTWYTYREWFGVRLLRTANFCLKGQIKAPKPLFYAAGISEGTADEPGTNHKKGRRFPYKRSQKNHIKGPEIPLKKAAKFCKKRRRNSSKEVANFTSKKWRK
jgi:hypothetical protein